MKTKLLPTSLARVASAFLLALAGSILSPAAQAQVTNWNAARDFYFDSTSYAQNGGSWAGTNAPSAAGQAWGYYAVNANWYGGYPKQIGVYFPPGTDQYQNQSLNALANYQPLGIGQGKPSGDDAFYAIGGKGLAVYAVNPVVGVGRPFVGYYDYGWFDAAPGYGTQYANLGGLILQSAWLGGTEALGGEGFCTVVTWKAPSAGTYDFTGSFLVANNGTSGANGLSQTSIAIVDSQGGTPLPRTVVLQGTYNPFTFRKILNQGDVVQFQVGTAYQVGAMVGLNVDVNLVPGAVTSWNALRDFYFDSTSTSNSVSSWAGATNRLATAGGSAWGYYAANCNKEGGFPSQIGTYFPPGSNTAANEVLMAMANYQPLGAGQGQIAGGVAGSGDAYDATGGFGYARYADKFGWGVSLGAFAKAWFPGAPGYSTDSKAGIWMQAGLSNQSDREGICPVVTWTAPVSGIYDFKGSFQIGNNGDGSGASIAIVDSRGGVPLPRLSAVMGVDYPFGFRKFLGQGDIVQFQVGSDFKLGAAVGLNADVTLVQKGFDAYSDFYFTAGTAGWSGATSPSESGAAWGYYAANVNGFGLPTAIGSYFTTDSSGGNLYSYSTNSPLGAASFVGSGAYDPTGGTGFVRYTDNAGWGSSLGRFDNAWFDGAPGFNQGLSKMLWLQAGYLNNTNASPNGPAEGIAPVLVWKAPSAGTYTFHGKLVAANQVGNGASVAVVDSVNGPLQARISLPLNTVNSFSFTRSYNAGDVIQFQVGGNYQVGNAVGLDLSVNQKIDSLLQLTGSTALAFTGSGVTPALALFGSTNAPTYSYIGVDGTTYGPSSNAPTARGRYQVTAITASEDAWSSSTNKFYYGLGTFDAFKDFSWNRPAGAAIWTDPAKALAQGRSQATPTAMNVWSYGSIDCTTSNGYSITAANLNRTFRSLGGSSYSDAGPSWSYNSGDGSRPGTQVSWSGVGSNNSYLSLIPSAGTEGADGLAPAVRWTAPAAGKYRFKGSFVSAGTNPMAVAIQTLGNENLDDNATFLDRTTVAAGASQAFDTVQDVVGGQTVTWVVGSDGSSDGDVMLLSANVDQVTPLTISGVAVANKDYDGSTSATVSGTPTLVGVLPGHDVSLTNLAVVFNSANAGIQGVTVTAGLTGADAGIYTLSVPTDVTGLINKATPTISSAPTASPITQGQTLASSELTGGSASVGGTFAWTTDSTAPGSSGSYPVTFTPTDSANYNTASTSVNVTVNSAAPTGSSFAGWRGTNPASAALLENYAFGADTPSGAVSRSNLPTGTVSNGSLILTYFVRKEATNPDLVVPQLSTNLGAATNWSGLPASNIATVGTNTVNGVEVVKKTASVPVDSTGRKFLRLKIQE